MAMLALFAAFAFWLGPPDTKILQVPSDSMAPTIPAGGRVAATLGAYDGGEVRLGDIVLLHPPSAVEDWNGEQCGDVAREPGAMCAQTLPGLLTDVTFVQRVVGLPGDQLSLSHGRLVRNGQRVDEPFIAPCEQGYSDCDFPTTITVPADRYFLLGDNRGASDDSRYWGPVPKEALFARVDGCRPHPKVGCPKRVAVPAPPPPDRPIEKRRQPSESMAPTISVGDHFLANYDAYDRAAPQRADIVVFYVPASAVAEETCVEHHPDQMCPRSKPGSSKVPYVKRIVGLPGDRLSMRNGRLIRNGKRVPEPYIADCGGEGCDYPRTITVPQGQYFVLGDNRGISDDSRFWGPVRAKAILARVDRCIPQPKIGCPRRG